MNDLIPRDSARCSGNGQPPCARCLRRLQVQLDNDATGRGFSPWPLWWVDATATPDGCAVQLLPEPTR